MPREFLARDPDYLSDILYPTNLSFEFTVVVGTCSLLRDVPSEVITAAGIGSAIQDALQRLIDSNAIGGFFVDRGLMRGRDETIYEGEVPDIVRSMIGTLPIHLPNSEELRGIAAELLDEGCKNSGNPTWLPAGAIVRHHPLSEELRTRIHEIAKSLADSAMRASLNDRDVVLALAFLAGQIGTLQDASLREEVRAIAIRVAEEFGTGKRDAGRLRENRPAFFEIALGLSARHGDASGSARELANFVDDLIRSWPSLAYSLAAWLGDYVWMAPPDQGMSLWRMLLRARENAFQARIG